MAKNLERDLRLIFEFFLLVSRKDSCLEFATIMHFYSYDVAPSPRRAVLLLRYKGVDLPTTQVDMRANEHRSDDYLAINPQGTVPALMTDEGVLLTEVLAICDYLDAKFPEKPVFGSTPLERALVLNWMNKISGSLFMAFAEMLRNGSPAFANRALPGPIDVEQIPELADRGRKRYRASLELFEQEVGAHPFLCGEALSQADIDMYIAIHTGSWVKESLPESCVRLREWYARTATALGE
ncbi:MAG: glutathione S-transferase family protein [Pseudomonadota bacterium]